MPSITITITDTGKRSTSSTVAEETGTTGRANSGSAITLKGAMLTYDGNALVNNQMTFNKMLASNDRFQISEVDAVGVECPKWTIEGLLNWDDSDDRLTWGKLVSLLYTKGYKTITASNTLLSYSIECASNTTVNVRITSLKAANDPNSSLVKYTMECVQTA